MRAFLLDYLEPDEGDPGDPDDDYRVADLSEMPWSKKGEASAALCCIAAGLYAMPHPEDDHFADLLEDTQMLTQLGGDRRAFPMQVRDYLNTIRAGEVGTKSE